MWYDKGDYQDFQKFDRETIEPLIDQSEEFINEIRQLIEMKKRGYLLQAIDKRIM